MSLPASLLTTTCDIYHDGLTIGPPAATNVPCQLVADYAGGSRVSGSSSKPWTHYLLLDTSVDVRDSYPGMQSVWSINDADVLRIPSGGTTDYVVLFVEVRAQGTAGEHKRVYVDRQAPAWPDL